MREAGITAGLVQASRAGDLNWRDRLRIITSVIGNLYRNSILMWSIWLREPEAAAVHCAHLTNLHHLKPSQNFMICDAGDGTVVRLFPFSSYSMTVFGLVIHVFAALV